MSVKSARELLESAKTEQDSGTIAPIFIVTRPCDSSPGWEGAVTQISELE